MENVSFVAVMLLALVILVIAWRLQHVAALHRFHLPLRIIACTAQMVVVGSLAFWGFVCYRIIEHVARHNRSFFALPFIRVTGVLLLLPLILISIKTVLFHFRPARPPHYGATFLYALSCALYIFCLHVGLIMLGMSVVPNPLTMGVMITLAILSCGFYLYTYRQFRRTLG